MGVGRAVLLALGICGSLALFCDAWADSTDLSSSSGGVGETNVPPTLPEPKILRSILDQLNREDQPNDVKLSSSKHARAGHCGMERYNLELRKKRARTSKLYRVLAHRSGGRVKDLFMLLHTVHVDADGSPRAYHPEDPLGRGRCELTSTGGRYTASGVCALDQLASGGVRLFKDHVLLNGSQLGQNWNSIWTQIEQGEIEPASIGPSSQIKADRNYYLYYSPRSRLTSVFKRDIIPATRAARPCMFGSQAEFPGYFVSATALRNQNAPSPPAEIAPRECEAEKYINAEQIPFFVLPSSAIGDLRIGDLVIADTVYQGQQRTVFGVVGDVGPAQQLGEASIAFVQELLGQGGKPVMNAAELNRLDIGPELNLNVGIVVLGGSKHLFQGNYSRDNIQNVGRQQFAAWGGRDRLNACVSQIGVSRR